MGETGRVETRIERVGVGQKEKKDSVSESATYAGARHTAWGGRTMNSVDAVVTERGVCRR